MEKAVQIEKDIQDLSSMQKFDQLINLANFYHLYRCQIENAAIVILFATWDIFMSKTWLTKLNLIMLFKNFADLITVLFILYFYSNTNDFL